MRELKIALVGGSLIIRLGIQALIEKCGITRAEVTLFDSPDGCNCNGFNLMLLDDAGITPSRTIRHIEQAKCEVVILSSRLNAAHIQRVMRAGARGFIYHEELESHLIPCLDIIQRGPVSLSPQALDVLMTADRLIATGDLSPQDRRVLELTAEGCTVKEMAQRIGVTSRAIYRSRAKLRDILQAPTNETIVEAARRLGLLEG